MPGMSDHDTRCLMTFMVRPGHDERDCTARAEPVEGFDVFIVPMTNYGPA